MSVAKKLWVLSGIVTVILVVWLVAILVNDYYAYDPDSEQLIDLSATQQFIQNWQKKYNNTQPLITIPTGVFVESLRFMDSQTVHLTGYIWQRIPKNANTSPGFVLPEAIDLKQEVAYQQDKGNERTIGWYIETKLVHAFDYKKYPLDHKIVWLRIWPKDFFANVLLVPDLGAYDSTLPRDKFGLDADISIDGYTVLETFFKFGLPSYDTNFGIADYVGQKDNLELFYNIALKRNALDSLIVHVLPILLIVSLMFFRILYLSCKIAFNMNDEIRLEAMLLFVVLLSHIQLRQMFSGMDIVYIEYIYFIIYFLIFYLLLMTYLADLCGKQTNSLKWLRYENCIIPKILFLPITFGLALLITSVIL